MSFNCNICMEEHEDKNLIKTCKGNIFCKTCFNNSREECFKKMMCPLYRSELLEDNMVVKKIIKIHENENNYDEMVGWTKGLNSINQKKISVSKNAISYEKNAKKGIKQYGHMKSSLMLYYVKQEDDFNNWWYEHDTRNILSRY